MTSKGHIYKIICKVDEKFCYIGSTFNRLSKRFEEHRNLYNRWKDGKRKTSFSCFPYFDKYGIENFKIVLIKSYDVCRAHKKDRKHLEAYETLWICKTKCVNKVLPIQYLKKQYQQEYHDANRDKLNEYGKEYSKKYHEANRDKINEKKKEKITCECGTTVIRSGLSTHRKTNKHKKLLLLNK